MLKVPAYILLVLLIILSLPSLYADEKRWDDLQEQAITYFQAQDHRKAVEAQTQALEEAKATFGPEHRNVAESLDNLAIYYQALGRNDEAEKLYLQALAIMEATAQPGDRYLAIFMNYVAGFYKRIGKPDEAARLEERARAIRAQKAE